MAHGIDSLRETNISQHLISSKVSQSPVSMPIDSPGSNHVNTWRIAYEIEHIRDWLFRQVKA